MDERTLQILTPLQRQVLDTLCAEEAFSRSFYLTGGTALAAFYLFHRYSDDLDFFTNAQEVDFLWPMLQSMHERMGFVVESRTPRFIRLRLPQGPLRIDFVQDVPFRLGSPVRYGAWPVDTRENILANKITAIQGRLDAKDYVDLYFLLKKHNHDILKCLALAKQKDASIDPFMWSRVIGEVEQLRILPRMIVPVHFEELVSFYRALRKDILRSLKSAS